MLALAKERRTPFCEPMAALTDRRNPLLRVTQALPLLSLKSKDPTCYSSGHLRPLAWRKSLRARQSFRARQSLLRTRFCIGSGNCPVLVQVMKNCGSDADQIAQEICTVRLAGGERRELEYQLLHEGTRDGGKCGYPAFTG